MIESLEVRRMLSALPPTIGPQNIHMVRGSDANESYVISGPTEGDPFFRVTIQANGGPIEVRKIPKGQIKYLKINTLGGNDSVTVANFPADVLLSINGGAGDDLLTAGANPTTLVGGGGMDTLVGTGGNSVAAEFNVANAVISANTITGPGVHSEFSNVGGGIYVEGTAGDDLMNGTASPFPVTLVGGNGADTLLGSNFADLLSGGRGIDLLNGGLGNDTLAGGPSNDQLIGGAGNNIAYATGRSLFVRNTTISGEVFRTLNGEGQDTLTQINGLFLEGTDVNDTLDARNFPGPVTLFGGAGNDTLRAGLGGGVLYGDVGNDTLFGGAGPDHFVAGKGENEIFAGPNDSATNQYFPAFPNPFGLIGAYDERFSDLDNLPGVLPDTGAAIRLTDTLLRNAGELTHLHNLLNFTIYGTTGPDRIDTTSFTGGVTVNAGDGDDQVQAGNSANGQTDLFGNKGNDALFNNSNQFNLDGGPGNDIMAAPQGEGDFTGDGGVDIAMYYNLTGLTGTAPTSVRTPFGEINHFNGIARPVFVGTGVPGGVFDASQNVFQTVFVNTVGAVTPGILSNLLLGDGLVPQGTLDSDDQVLDTPALRSIPIIRRFFNRCRADNRGNTELFLYIVPVANFQPLQS